ncbi:MAG: hypothetical protein ACYCVD_07630 [Desulfitobacteriaceae bacterium]
MAIVAATLSSGLSTSTYAAANDLLGQFKTMIQNDSNVTIITDTNPGTGTGRSITYKVGDFPHYFRIWAYSFTAFKISMRNLADSSDIVGIYATTGMNLVTGIKFKLMYSSRTHLIIHQDVETLLVAVKGNSGLWYGACTGNVGGTSSSMSSYPPVPLYAPSTCYNWLSRADDYLGYCGLVANYGNKSDSSGGVYLAPYQLTTLGGDIIDYLPQFTATTFATLVTLAWYNDGTLNYYFRTPCLVSE